MYASLSILYLRCEAPGKTADDAPTKTAFNSLFEMQPEGLHEPMDVNEYILSILYLRCYRHKAVKAASQACTFRSFNSLFEMQTS